MTQGGAIDGLTVKNTTADALVIQGSDGLTDNTLTLANVTITNDTPSATNAVNLTRDNVSVTALNVSGTANGLLVNNASNTSVADGYFYNLSGSGISVTADADETGLTVSDSVFVAISDDAISTVAMFQISI